MDDELDPSTESEAPAPPAGPKVITRDQKDFEHRGLGLQLELKFCADELLQKHVEKFMVAYRSDKRGNSITEQYAKTLVAAILAGWIVSPEIALRDIGGMPPAHVRWYSACIDAVYALATEIPPES